jgi:poly-gamma-glutamate capsule biosynthesis protein CapA/YwtB (metallophosphatase superfamily)
MAAQRTGAGPHAARPITLFLAGDVMTGRGIDQVLPHSVDPRLHESYVKSAETYVELAEEASGPIPDSASYDYVWGDTLQELSRVSPDARIINLETAVTTSDDWWRDKGIHYRMHPENVRVLTAAGIDACTLGNNHVLDWGRAGLRETLSTLREAGLAAPGAGLDLDEAAAPAVLQTGSGRLLVFSWGAPSAGVPRSWQAGPDRPGVNLLPDLSPQTAQEVVDHVQAHRREGDRVVVSLHWGPNWGYDVPPAQRGFAHRLVDAGAADIVHGHSSHHPKGIEVRRGRPILYGCGDFLNDYEGIGGKERFRGELTLMYFPTLDDAGALTAFELVPMRIHRFRLECASEEEARWLSRTLDRESRPFGTRVEQVDGGRLALRWD